MRPKTFKRQQIEALEQWKIKPKRKPLILRGARQVGKTTLVNTFSEGYDNFIALNLERASDLRYFKDYKDVKTLADALFLAKNILDNKRLKHFCLLMKSKNVLRQLPC
jgi:predicted AAA+ superfamily ATPase